MIFMLQLLIFITWMKDKHKKKKRKSHLGPIKFNKKNFNFFYFPLVFSQNLLSLSYAINIDNYQLHDPRDAAGQFVLHKKKKKIKI